MRLSAGQVWNAEDYTTKAAFVPELGSAVLAFLAPKSGEQILDLGCGDGALTLRIAESGAWVTGLEPSAELASVARARGLEVIELDAHDPDRVLGNAFAALRPGGRLVVEQGGFGNVVAVVTAIHAAFEGAGYGHLAECPWDFPSVTTQRQRLERVGFQVDEIVLLPRPTHLEAGMAGWLPTFAGPYFTDLTEAERTDVTADIVRRLGGLLDREEGWFADYVRLRFHASRLG